MASEFVGIERVLAFVDRTTSRGVPVRVAERRAERRFGINRHLVHSFLVSRPKETLCR